MVSQVIAYHREDKRYFAVGPEWNSIVSMEDLTDRLTGISLSEYRNDMDGKNHTNATYIPQEETHKFTKNLSAMMCTEFPTDDWNCESFPHSRFVVRVVLGTICSKFVNVV
ncbi:hypothetical protein FGIG_06470 [Fasciola gigantica]|uniref:Uncharacterized protein n=1 Tax=Fasciola gigantica TaxID=46835 RepID=A0A504YNW7_FASGI|nr:hypothetical protein FGIG_06470 [Fasciola gigantica]